MSSEVELDVTVDGAYGANVGRSSDIHYVPLETEAPAGLAEPAGWRLFVMPVQVRRKSKGGILFADESMDAQMWLHAIGRVVGMGPLCFQHPRFKQLGWKPEMAPKVGDLIIYSARTPTRFKYKGLPILVINDDQLLARNPDPDTLDQYSFYS